MPGAAEAGPVPLGVGRTPTGNADVDAALDRIVIRLIRENELEAAPH